MQVLKWYLIVMWGPQYWTGYNTLSFLPDAFATKTIINFFFFLIDLVIIVFSKMEPYPHPRRGNAILEYEK